MNDRPSPSCPSCRYRLEGETSRWEAECPLRGTCPECGAGFEWRIVFGPVGSLRWAFDVPGVRGLSLRRWLGTTIRVLRPGLFWRNLSVVPLAVPRLVLWLVVTILVLHTVNAGCRLVERSFNVANWSSPGDPFPFWQGAGVTLEMLGSPYYDMGEMTARGAVEPMYFLDRFRAALACGSLAAGVALTLGGVFRRGSVRPDALARAVVYGLMPLALSYVYFILWVVIQVIGGDVLHVPMQWWFGWPTPTGRIPGGSTWFARAVNIASAAWLAWWWWEAAGAAMVRPRRWTRVLVVAISLGAAALVFVEFLNYWNRWWML